MKNKSLLILEITWLVVAIACLALGIYKNIIENNRFNFTFFILSAVSLLMYMLRRSMRKNNMYK